MDKTKQTPIDLTGKQAISLYNRYALACQARDKQHTPPSWIEFRRTSLVAIFTTIDQYLPKREK